MALNNFHILLIGVGVLFFGGFGLYALLGSAKLLGIVSSGASVGLALYLRNFIHSAKPEQDAP